MNIDSNTTLEFYQNLGKLFYAIAAADNVVRDEEIKKVEELVKEYWIHKNITPLVSKNISEQIIMSTFNELNKFKSYNTNDCFSSFISFKKQNEFMFTSKLNSLILKTVGKISASFSGQNKAELIMLARLNIELKK
ncbi:hypothetical protein BZARG_2381 [Bizionia argentinensis JUB59]|uniref:TerB family tellurite resistance protein n=1 Tax=Bizionia argentinensis JUB59 TaxID=1046627 RepID=G2ECD9_9FLAO|nr:hypothetical protein [Bizionia argentinensis]EGV43898.1 hypothetical protein BZARG_2381 [Bizionia argentinensis JUB59]